MALAEDFGIPYRALDTEAARALEPSLAPVFRHAVLWEGGASVTNPLAVTRGLRGAIRGDRRRADEGRCALAPPHRRRLAGRNGRGADRFSAGRGGARTVCAGRAGAARDQRSRSGSSAATTSHFRPAGNAALARPVLDEEIGYCLAPMEQGIRLTTGVEFAARDAPPTPVQLERLLPDAKALFPLGEPVEATPWMGRRPCFPGLPAGDRPGARPARPLARLWTRPLGIDARPCHRAAPGRDDDRGNAVLRPGPLWCRAVRYSLIVRTTLEVGRPSTVGSLASLSTASS